MMEDNNRAQLVTNNFFYDSIYLTTTPINKKKKNKTKKKKKKLNIYIYLGFTPLAKQNW